MTKEELRKKQRQWIKKYYRTPKGKKYRYESRKKYYGRTQLLSSLVKRKWTPQEIELLFTYPGTDEELAYLICRSVAAIQTKRAKINQGE